MIRAATIDDLARASVVVAAFSADIGRPFDTQRFVNFFRAVMGAGMGVLFLLEQDNVIQGVLGGLATPDPYHGGMVASEMFWYVMDSARGGAGGGRLYRAFEQWAIARGCEEIQMVHLSASMPERLEQFYKARGYSMIETRYSKILQQAEKKEVA